MNASIINDNGKFSILCQGMCRYFLSDSLGRTRRFGSWGTAVKAAHAEGCKVYGNDEDFINPFYADWTENQLRNAIWDANSGRHWRGPFCEVEELRVELRRRGLSDKGFHED